VARLASEGKDKNKEKEEYAQVWHCLFCGTDNELNLDEEEVPTHYSAAHHHHDEAFRSLTRARVCVCVQMPKEESVDYILEAASEAGVSGGSSSSEKQLVFCIDISGSM
jgi:plasmid rolling circle replication initiator protein Rep